MPWGYARPVSGLGDRRGAARQAGGPRGGAGATGGGARGAGPRRQVRRGRRGGRRPAASARGLTPGPGRLYFLQGGDRFRRGSVRSRLRLEVSHPSLISENGIAANTQLALAA